MASIVFLILLAVLLLRESEFFNETIYILSRLNIFGILLATLDGFGAIVAYAGFPMIRCYDRISIFIAFFSLIAVFYVIQKFSDKYTARTSRCDFLLKLCPAKTRGLFGASGIIYLNLGGKEKNSPLKTPLVLLHL